jgi:hypothetical protein
LKKTFIALIIVTTCVVGYRLAYPTYTHRYRLTVNVETPHGLKSGSSVVQVTMTSIPRLLGSEHGQDVSTKGEAAFVDLGDKNVTALLTRSDPKFGYQIEACVTLAIKVFDPECEGRGCQRSAIRYETGTRIVPPQLMPTLVTFGNLDDPRSAKIVAPGEFENVFGAGYRLKDVTISITTDPIEWKIEEQIPALKGLRTMLGGQFIHDRSNPAMTLSPIDFRRDQ